MAEKWIDLWTVNAKMCTHICCHRFAHDQKQAKQPTRKSERWKKHQAVKVCNRKNNNYNAFLIALSDRHMPQWQILKNIHAHHHINTFIFLRRTWKKNPTRMHSSLSFHRRYNLFNLMFQRDRFHFALFLTGKERERNQQSPYTHAVFA